MRRRVGLDALSLPAFILVAACAGLAALGVIAAVRDLPPPNANAPAPWFDDALLARTAGVAIVIGIVATALALPGAWLARRLSASMTAALLAPLLLPTYLVYASWGLLRAPGTALGDWAARAGPDAIRTINMVQALGGLALWSWPIGAVIVGVAARRITDDELDALRSAQPSCARRALFIARRLSPALALSTGAIALIMLGSAIPLHVAQVETYAITIWRLMNESADASRVWLAATPLLLIGVIGGGALGAIMIRYGDPRTIDWRERSGSPARSALAVAGVIWIASALAPALIFVWSLREWLSLGRAFVLLRPALLESAVVGAWVALCGVIIVVGAIAGFRWHAGRAARVGSVAALLALCAAAVTPGVLIGAALLSASRFDGLYWLAERRAGLVAAHTLRFGVIAALAGWWVSRLEPRDAADLRELESSTLMRWRRTLGPGKLGVIGAGALAMFFLSMHEIEATVMLAPPGHTSLAHTLLSQLHYLRMEELSAAGVWLTMGGLAVILALALLVRGVSRFTQMRAAMCGALAIGLIAGGCDRAPQAGPQPLRSAAAFGEVGDAPGQIIYPRCIDATIDSIWIIDRTARVQRFTHEGDYLGGWTMPAFERGKPTGVTIGPDGLIYVADTHEHRVSVFNESGDMVDEWGTYGAGDGEFIYPTDVAFLIDDDGAIERIYVSEYGGTERISVFNRAHEFLFSFGEEGSGASADPVQFARPQSIAIDHDRRELYVTDSSNHRVGRFTLDGELIAWIGRDGALPGEAPGEFRYPYGLALLDDGTLLVSEFGGNRVQRIDPQRGVSLGDWGGPGFELGYLRTPWGVAAANGTAFVLDSGNNRVQSFDPDRQARVRIQNEGSSAP